MIHLKDINDKKGIEFIKNLLSQYVVVSEKLDGLRFSFKKDETGKLKFYKRDGKSAISKVDRTLMKVYEAAIEYIESLPSKVIDEIPQNYHMGFEYFFSNKPVAITYDRLPKNKLVLTDIQIQEQLGKTQKIIDDPDILFQWADKLEVGKYPLIYKGKLDKNQRMQLLEYLETPIDQLIQKFSTESFVRYIITILNPSMKRTALMDDLDKPIEGVVFKFRNQKGEEFFAKVVDPIFTQAVKNKKKTESDQSSAVAFLRFFVNWLKDINIDKYIKNAKGNKDDKYISVLSNLFFDFYTENEKHIEAFNIQVKDFLTKDEFKININNIKEIHPKNLIASDPLAHDTFRIMLSGFRKIRKRATSEVPKDIVKIINSYIEQINRGIDNLNEGVLFSFQQWSNINIVIESLFEAFSLQNQKSGKEKVNFMVGRFQPPTLGHLKVIEQIHDQNGYPVVIFTVRSKKRNPEKTPFSDDTINKMFMDIKNEYPNLIADFIKIPSAGIDTIIDNLRPKMEPVLWGTGTDRLKGYQLQTQRYRDYPGFPNIEIYEIKRGDDDISASKVRKAIRNNDFNTYKKMMPKSTHKYFDILKKELS